MSDYDVVIVGSGMAGLCAALTATDGGASVLVVDGAAEVGGSSRLAGGQMMGAGTRIQRQNGITDSAEDLFRHYMSLNQWTVEPTLVRRLADESGPAIDWLADLGVPFHPTLFFSGDEAVPRDHVPQTFGMGVIGVLEAEVRRRGVDIALGKRVDRLLVDGGRVVGIASGDDEVSAGAVIITTGGFGANQVAVKEHYPRAAQAGDSLWYIGADTAQGDALGLGAQVDAQIIGGNRGLLLLAPDFGPGLDVYLPGWLVVVNQHGHRFFDEMSPYSTTETAVRAQNGPVYAIFDDAARAAADRASAPTAKRQQFPGVTELMEFKWIEPLINEMIDKGVVHRADTIEELAALIGVPPENLAGTVEHYNADLAAGEDSSYLKPVEYARPITTPPYHATELRLSLLCLTSTGLRIDRNARVINQRSQPVPGLYAAGECTGGVLGDIYVGSGNSYTNCLVFGRVAGRFAAQEAHTSAPSGSH
jgi:fumarate reductase flavoprotein subunit